MRASIVSPRRRLEVGHTIADLGDRLVDPDRDVLDLVRRGLGRAALGSLLERRDLAIETRGLLPHPAVQVLARPLGSLTEAVGRMPPLPAFALAR